MSLGRRIAAARKQAAMKQHQVAEALNVTPQAISHWETDKYKPEYVRLVALSNLLNVDYTWLLTGSDTAPVSSVMKQSLSGRVPLISIMEAIEFYNLNIDHDYILRKDQITFEETWNRPGVSFALLYTDDMKIRDLKVSDIIIFNNFVTPSVGDIVVCAMLTKSGFHTVVSTFESDDKVNGVAVSIGAARSRDHLRGISALIETGAGGLVVGTAVEVRRWLKQPK